MANTLYDKARGEFAKGNIDWINDTIKVTLVSVAYNSAHDFIDDIAGGSRVATSSALTGKAVDTNGAVDANDVTFTSVSGAQVVGIVIWKDTTVEATSNLIAYLDSATGLPITPNGGDIIITWDNGTNKIFRL